MRGLSLFILAITCGTASMVGVMRWRSQLAQAPTEVETVDLVVASVLIHPNDQLTREMLGTKKWPKDFVPEGATNDPDAVLESYTTTQFVVGEPIIKAKLSKQSVGLTAKINPGMRAISVLTPKFSSSVAGLLLPGQHVDVLLTRKDGSKGGMAETLLQNVIVLAVDRQIRASSGEDEGGPKQVQSVTLEVSPQQAERLSSAQIEGEITMVLRSANDESIYEPGPPPRPKEQEDQLASAIAKLQKSVEERQLDTQSSLDKLQAMFTNRQGDISTAFESLKGAIAQLSLPLKEPDAVPAPPPTPAMEQVTQPDIPLYTLRGNVWGYVMTRKPIPRSSVPRDVSAAAASVQPVLP